ncbi:MAG: hypothetical protein LUB59_07535 [Candidatus Gastranaerophilales bacterium]|nr:hypothetical protein [Candidatus Gastranaerophilales bacterium]
MGIIADDLTGANDTALQFKKCNAETKILLDYKSLPENDLNTQIWAISTESRNIDFQEARSRMLEVIENIDKKLNLEHYYKKIDSTLRGNIAAETLAMVEALDYDASIIIPAFPQEGRITAGGYHLSKGIPIGRTEIARDPHSPITESHVPSLFMSQLKDDEKDFVGHIGLKTVMNGAGPVLVRINELIKNEKKLIIADAASLIDIEQIVLAINKSNYKILPAGTAATGSILAKLWVPEAEKPVEIEPVIIPKLPRFIVSGSATQINSSQIEQLGKSYDYDNIYLLPVNIEMVLNGVSDEFVNEVCEKLVDNNTVVVHSSKLLENFDGFSDDSLKGELTRAGLASRVTGWLAELTKRVIEQKRVILITLGGETSYKCCSAISSKELTMKDEAAPAIALCVDYKNQWIITKSGNLGNPKTLIEILNYIGSHEQ